MRCLQKRPSPARDVHQLHSFKLFNNETKKDHFDSESRARYKSKDSWYDLQSNKKLMPPRGILHQDAIEPNIRTRRGKYGAIT